MIAKLSGRIDSVGDGWAVIDVGGVGYLVYSAAPTLGRLVVGGAASLLIETHVREDHIHLYGFLDLAERDWFRLLTTVQGVGARVALAIQSVLTPDDLLRAVAASDKAAITRAAGVGPKLAARVAAELKDKVAAIALGPGAAAVRDVVAPGGEDGQALRDAASALVNLGYGASDAFAAVSGAAADLGDGATVEALIRKGLARLGGDKQ